jgi:hypothetical protein
MKYQIETEDQDEFRLHFNGPKAYGAIWDFQQYLRNKWKYNDVENEAWMSAAQTLTELLLDNGINMEEDYV